MKKQRPRIGKKKAPVQQPVAQPVVQQAHHTIVQPVQQPVVQPQVPPVAQPVVQPVAQPVASPPKIKPVKKSVEKPPKVILCPTCKWYDLPLKGKSTCRQKETSKAKCKDFSIKNPILDQDILLIKQDPFVEEINSILNNPEYLLPLDEYKEELKLFLVYNRKLNNNTTLRKVPKHVETMMDFQALEEILEEVQAYRDRVTFMKMEVLTKQSSFEKIWKTAKTWLMQFSYYNNIKTKDDRTDFAGDVFDRFYDYMEDMKTTMKLMDMVMDNLNASYFLTTGKFNIAKIVIERYKSL